MLNASLCKKNIFDFGASFLPRIPMNVSESQAFRKTILPFHEHDCINTPFISEVSNVEDARISHIFQGSKSVASKLRC